MISARTTQQKYSVFVSVVVTAMRYYGRVLALCVAFACCFTLVSIVESFYTISLFPLSQSWSSVTHSKDEACFGERNGFPFHGAGFDIFRPFCESDSAGVSHSFQGRSS